MLWTIDCDVFFNMYLRVMGVTCKRTNKNKKPKTYLATCLEQSVSISSCYRYRYRTVTGTV